jgi:S1-C subfamily serine protease
MNLDAGQRGTLVEEIFPNSPAEKAGLQGSNEQVAIDGLTVNVGGDVIVAIDDQPVTSMDDVIAYLTRDTKVGQDITLKVLRDGKEQTLDVTLAARPSAEEPTNPESAVRGVRLGILGVTVDSSIAQEMNLPNGQGGILVQQVEPGSLAEIAGLRAGDQSVTLNGQQVQIGGDVITAVNGQSVASTEELRAALVQLSSTQEFTVTILRDGTEIELTVQPGL